MSSLAWMAALQTKVAAACSQTDSTTERLQIQRRDLLRRLDKAIDSLGESAVSREARSASEMHERVMALLGAGNAAELSLRERRYAAKQVAALAPSEMQTLLATYPACWSVFATECFRCWEVLATVSDRPGYVRLLCLAPDTVPFLHGVIPARDIIVGGPRFLARQTSGADLSEARATLQHHGFDSTWSFTAMALACWAEEKAIGPTPFAAFWGAVRRDVVAEAMLLPRLRTGRESWFSNALRPPRVRSSGNAQAGFVSTLLRRAYDVGVLPAHWSELTEKLLLSEFRDPRMPPESEGWTRVKAIALPAYERFMEELVAADLEVFFEHAMTDFRRKDFWLRYLTSIRRTVCILDQTTYAALRRSLAGASDKMSAALSRARRFRARGGTQAAQAFCLYFESFVVVEFSETGNAAQIYERALFEKRFESDIYADRCESPSDLKRRDAKARIIHRGDAWEQRAAGALAGLGIRPDGRRWQ